MEQRHEDEVKRKKKCFSSDNNVKSSDEESIDLFQVPTALGLTTREKYLSLGCPNLDRILNGGISNQGITQIYGAASTGKTQFALQLCLTVQLPVSHGGCEAGAVYISTEGSFPSRRLQDLLQQSDIARNFKVSGDAIFVETLTEVSELENCITERLPRLFTCRKIGLLVLDSIAAPFRAEYSTREMKARAKTLWNIAFHLHSLAREYALTVVCINQVSATVSSNSREPIHVSEQPALGITWANMITNNFYLCRNESNRYFHIMHSSHLPRATMEYKITNFGVLGIVES